MKLRELLICAILVLGLPGLLPAQLRIVSHNTLGKPQNASDELLVRTIYGAIADRSANGIAKRPDLIGLQEQVSGSPGTANRFASALNTEFSTTAYQAVIHSSGNFRQAYVYDSNVLTLIDSGEIALGIRPALYARWRLAGYDANSDFYTYNVHLKAGKNASDEVQRNNSANSLRIDADGLGSSEHIIYMGDFNFSSSSEAGFSTMTAAGNGQAFDPLGISSWPSALSRISLTQSTRTAILPDGGANGGVDDRFDFQLISHELLDGDGLSYMGTDAANFAGVEDSYIAFGNDGMSYNVAINATYNGREQPMVVLDALHDFSDHLPVVADYQLPAKMLVTPDAVPGRVIVGATVNVNFSVENTAPVDDVIAADELEYIFVATGDLNGVGGGSDPATGGAVVESFSLETTSVGGNLTGTLQVTALSEQTGGATSDTPVEFDVVDHAQGSFSDETVQITETIHLGSFAIGGAKLPNKDIEIYNLASQAGASLTADLDLDSISETDTDDKFAITGALFNNLPPDSFETFSLVGSADSIGSFAATFVFNISDEDLPGQTQSSLTLNVTMDVVGILGDMDGSGTIDFDDLDPFVLAVFDRNSYEQMFPGIDADVIGDISGDGSLTFDDIDGFVDLIFFGN